MAETPKGVWVKSEVDMKLNDWLILHKEFGIRNFTQANPEEIKTIAKAYLDTKDQVQNLQIQKKVLFRALEFAQDDIYHLKSKNTILTMKLDTSESMNYTHWFLHVLGFSGFSFVAWSLINFMG